MLEKIRLENTFVLFLIGAVFTAAVYLGISFLQESNYLRIFFVRSWTIHAPNTCLFVMGIFFLIAKYRNLRQENNIIKILNVQGLGDISFERAKKLLNTIPEASRKTNCFLRLSELLKGYLHQEDLITLNGELSRRDREMIDSGHLLLDSLRQIIPILGFLGTVLGLALGMLKFPEVAASSSSVESLRGILKDLAASLSVAFETTLLALIYTIILVLLASLLRRQEEVIVNGVDEKARELIGKIKFKSELESERLSGSSRNHPADDKIVLELQKLISQLAMLNENLLQRLIPALPNPHAETAAPAEKSEAELDEPFPQGRLDESLEPLRHA